LPPSKEERSGIIAPSTFLDTIHRVEKVPGHALFA
jgi:hypothetical protein